MYDFRAMLVRRLNDAALLLGRQAFSSRKCLSVQSHMASAMCERRPAASAIDDYACRYKLWPLANEDHDQVRRGPLQLHYW